MYMVMFVLDDPDRLGEVLDAWESAGITGATIIESTGLHRVQRRFIPMRYIAPVTETERNHVTLMTIVPGEAQVRACLAQAEAVVGDLCEGDTGVFAAWPLVITKGVAGAEG